MSELPWSSFGMAVARHGFTLFAGWAVAHGIATNDQLGQITAGALALYTVGWSLWEKHRAAQKQKGIA